MNAWNPPSSSVCANLEPFQLLNCMETRELADEWLLMRDMGSRRGSTVRPPRAPRPRREGPGIV